MRQTCDRTLVNRVLSGNGNAFRELVTDYQRLVAHVVFRMVRNESDREDLCQEILVRVYQNLSGFEFKSKLSTWIARIAFNTCSNYLDKKKCPLYDDITPEDRSIEDVETYELGPEDFAISSDIADRVHEEIAELPVTYRTILTLYHLDEMTYREIGEITGLPDGTVKSYLFRARRLLRELLLKKYSVEELWD